LTYQTAWRLWRTGRLPLPATQLPTGTILVYPPEVLRVGGAALYARVSSHDQKADLERQLGRLAAFASERGLAVVRLVAAVGSGLNRHRPKLLRLLGDAQVRVVVVEHRDRLARFGAEYIEGALLASRRGLVVVDPSEMADDLARDMIEVLTSFCARRYGRRSARGRVEQAIVATRGDHPC